MNGHEAIYENYLDATKMTEDHRRGCDFHPQLEYLRIDTSLEKKSMLSMTSFMK